jgi:hypothetical protein
MTYQEYEELSHEAQLDAFNKYGVEIMERQEGGKLYLLHQIDAFYVEMIFDVINESADLRCFADLDELSPYLEQINIELPR